MSLKEAEELLSRCRALSQKVAIYAKRLVGESDALAVEVKSLQASISALRRAAAEKVSDDGELEQVLDLLSDASQTVTGMGPGGDLRRLSNPKHPWLLRMLLGSKVSVVCMRKDQAIGIREEYHAFRSRAVPVMFVVPLILFIGMRRADAVAAGKGHLTLTPPLMTGMQLYLAWMAYFYLTLALRECVLLVNGSQIRPWWVHHHYWSAGCSLIMLALPVSSPTVYYFSENFMLLSCYQALVMLVQNRYQRRRMYTRIALGKNSAMDVVSGEASGSRGQLLLLYPLLFAMQAWQCVVGVHVAVRTWPALLATEGWLEMERCQSDLRGMRGTFLCGCIYSWLSVMNFWNTVATITDKASSERRRYKQRRVAGGTSGGGGRRRRGGRRGRRRAAAEGVRRVRRL
ncbi:MAG: TMPIT-like protein [Monoraphidium minutum]|nr:MAG: TMPIT-like protein [Monoraphidium minutum]